MIITIVMREIMHKNPKNKITVKVRVRKIEAKVTIDIKSKKVSVLECNLMKKRCLNCVPFCEVIVAAKDFAFGRRKPKGEVVLLSRD